MCAYSCKCKSENLKLVGQGFMDMSIGMDACLLLSVGSPSNCIYTRPNNCGEVPLTRPAEEKQGTGPADLGRAGPHVFFPSQKTIFAIKAYRVQVF